VAYFLPILCLLHMIIIKIEKIMTEFWDYVFWRMYK